MAKEIEIKQYDTSLRDKWDKFLMGDTINGTFLQSRRFIEYHPENRFQDNSLLFMCGDNIIAVIPANIVQNDKKILYSHQGSTFGGIIIGKQFCKITYLDLIFERLNDYLQKNNFDEIVLKQPGRIYQQYNTELLDYYLFLNGYADSQEIGYYIDFSCYKEDVISNFTSSKRRDYRYALKNGFEFKELFTEEQINQFYAILCDNYGKFNKRPIHTAEELIDFKFNRLPDNTDFYGVYYNNEMIAAGMVFNFDKRVFHTQYLAVKQDKKNLFVNEFLYKELISAARAKGYGMLSFGTSTFDGGKILNHSLAQFKEGFGTTEYVNRTYRKYIH